jgi:hypothetical protein
MKNITFTILATLALGSISQAATLQCKDAEPSPDHGFQITVAADNKSATVGEETIAGLKNLATLNCVQPPPSTQPCCDHVVVTLVCADGRTKDDGYRIEISTGDHGAGTTAQLFQITFAGKTEVATLTCSSAGK